MGLFIKSKREKINITQEELAGITGYVPAMIGFIEQGRTFPSDEKLRKICDALNLDAMDKLHLFGLKRPEVLQLFRNTPIKLSSSPTKEQLCSVIENISLTEQDVSEILSFAEFKLKVAEQREQYKKREEP